MPKDWEGHKAELKRLYVTERKGLPEIKKILDSRGFHAALRSYRTRFHEWGYLKSQSTDPRRAAKATARFSNHGHGNGAQTKSSSLTDPHAVETIELELADQDRLQSIRSSRSHSPQTPTFSSAGSEAPHNVALNSMMSRVDAVLDRGSQSGYDSKLIGDYEIPSRLLDVTALGTFVPEYSYEYLCALFVAWQPEVGYMDALQEFLEDERACKWILQPPGEVMCHLGDDGDVFGIAQVFDAVKAFVYPKDRFEVMKRLLLAAGTLQQTQSEWIILWSKARNCHDWGEAQNLLSDSLHYLNVDDEELPFETAGRVVVAEQLLHHFQQNFVHGANYCDCICHTPRQVRRRMRQILDSFSNVEKEFDVDLKFYELPDQMFEGARKYVRPERALQLELRNLEETNKKYRKVISKLSGIAPKEVDGRLEHLLSITEDDLLLLHQEQLDSLTRSSSNNVDIAIPTVQLLPPVMIGATHHTIPDLTVGIHQQLHRFLHNWKSREYMVLGLKIVHPIIAHLDVAGGFGNLLIWIYHLVEEVEQLKCVAVLAESFVDFIAQTPYLVYQTFNLSPGAPAWAKLKRFVLGDMGRDARVQQYPSCKALLDHALLKLGEACLSLYRNAVNAVPQIGMLDIFAQQRTQCELSLEDLDRWDLQVDPELRRHGQLFSVDGRAVKQ